MSRPDPQPDRPPIEVRIRDLDKIREQTPLQIEPRQVGWGVALAGVLVASAFAGGYLLGTGALDRHAPSQAQPWSGVIDETGPGTEAPSPVPLATPPTPALASPIATTGSVVPVPDDRDASEPSVQPEDAHAADAPPAIAAPPPAIADPPPAPRPLEGAVQPTLRRPNAPWVRAVGIPPPWPAVLQSHPEARCSRLSPVTDCPQESLPCPPPTTDTATDAPPEGPAASDPPPPAPVPKPAPPPKETRRYQVQVRAYQDSEAAKTFLTSLTRMGYPARIVRFVDAQGLHWLRIRIGDYNSRVAALAFARRFNQQHGEQAVVVEVP